MSNLLTKSESVALAQPDLFDLQYGHAPQEERHRERPAVDLVRQHLWRQAQPLKQERGR